MRAPAPVVLSAGEQDPAAVAQAAHVTGLPLDLVGKVGRRLTFLSLVYGVGFLAVFCARWITEPGFGERDTFPVEAMVVGASVGLALVTTSLATGRRLRPERIITLGLVFEVLGGFGISMVEHWGIFGGGPVKTFGISWVCVWVVMFPLIVPSSPGKALIAALLTAGTGPIAYSLSVAFGRSVPQPYFVLVELFVPTYVCAAIAYLGARTVYRLGAQVRDARKMGSYELVNLLGRGGMGEVWRARHRFLSRPAAIKLIRPEALASHDGIHSDVEFRFEREAQATAALRSPHSIILYDFGVTQQGYFYYVMELLDGLDLQRLVERFGSIPVERTVHILRQICHSLMDAHGNGLIHRDIKPSNIFLCRYGRDFDFVKILDFGLVKSSQPLHPGDENLTVQNTVVGTPTYIAPEAIYAGHDIDARADLYSVGCVAYWLLAGRPVFVGETVGEILRQHLHEDPMPPSRCSELEIPADLDEIVLGCLRKRPEERLATAADLLVALDRLDAAPAWTPAKAASWWEIHLPHVSADTVETADRELSARHPAAFLETETRIIAPRVEDRDGRRP